jgi:hypothetical protein
MDVSIFSTYESVLSGKIKRFPGHTWEGHNHGKESFKRCFRYLINEHLSITKEELLERVNFSFFRLFKLGGGINLFNDSPYEAVAFSFPEWNIQPWELKSTPNSYWNLDTCKLAVRWLFHEKLKWDRYEICQNSTQLLFKEYKIEKAIQALRKKKIYPKTGFFEAIHFSFPEYKYMKWEFKNVGTWSKIEIKDAVKWIFEVELQWSVEMIQKRINLKIFSHHNLLNLFYIYFGNLYELMEYVYPAQDWTGLKEFTFFIRSEERIIDLRDEGKQVYGYKMTDAEVIEARKLYYSGQLNYNQLGEKYGFNNETMSNAIRGVTYSHIKEGIPIDDKFIRTSVLAKEYEIDERRIRCLIEIGILRGRKWGAFWYVDPEQAREYYLNPKNVIKRRKINS